MRTIFITGATGGLGRALCECFSETPCRIGIHTYRQYSEGEKLRGALNAKGCDAALFSAHLGKATSVKKMFQDFLARCGTIDLLINNAGVRQDRLFPNIHPSDWNDQVSVNLSGVFYSMREAGGIMQERGGGHIINVTSYAAYTGRIGQSAYTASKRGLIALTQSAAREWGGASIQVNAVCPGYLPTPMTAGLKPKTIDRIIRENALGRPSTLKEISAFIRHLSEMKHVSGQVFNLDSRIG
ncbi:MAG: SDR family NAD(P)-dependent oxidoreductase [Nitrospiria bacterium]